MYEGGAHAAMMKRTIKSTETIRFIDATSAKREETVGMKPSAMPTSLWQATLIDVTIDMTIGVATDVMIVGIATAAGPEEVEATGGIDHHGCRNYHLRSN
jgi:hypothetical protein